MVEVTVYSRSNCHLCDVAMEQLTKLSAEFDFIIVKKLIDNDADLENKYGESVPVILINGKPHDFFRVDPERFRAAMANI
jgi:glutaredoxin